MVKYGYIPFIEGGIAVTDPTYGPELQGQYRKEFTESNWLLRMETDTSLVEKSSILYFDLYIGRPTMMSRTFLKGDGANMSLSSPDHYTVTGQEIGMDSHRIFVGSMKNFEQFGESAALNTGTDNLFGELMVLTCKGDETPAGFVLMGSIHSTFADEERLFRHMLSGFDGREIGWQEYMDKTDHTSLAYKTLLANELRSARKYEQAPNTPSHDAPER